MALKHNYRNIVVLFILGVALLAVSFATAYIWQEIGRLSLLYALLGLSALLIVALRIKSLSPRSSPGSRWKKYALFTVLILVWTVLYVEVNYLATRINKRWDLTAAKQHTLTESTIREIQNLHQEIRLTAFYIGLPPKYLEDLFREYQRLSKGKVVTEIIDPIVQIGYAARFGNVISGKEQKVFVQSGSEQREIDFTDDVLTEEQLTNAIVRVTRKVRRVYFLIGHNENDIQKDEDAGLSAFNALLSTNHVITKRLMLGIEGTIPEDCDVLVVAGPKAHLSEAEVEIIQEYLHKGGDALFLIEHMLVTTPEQPLSAQEETLNPSLNEILHEWGVNVADDVVVDLASHASGDVGSPATRNYLTHRSIVNDLDYTFFIRPRSISFQRGRRATLKAAPIILTASTQQSWGETNRTLNVKFDEGEDQAGPVPIAFAIWEPKEEGEVSDTRIIVLTDADFLTNAYIGQYSNAKLGVNMINWLSEVDYQVIFDHKDIEVQRLDLTSMQKRQVGVILILMPLLIATVGILVWMRQRLV